MYFIRLFLIIISIIITSCSDSNSFGEIFSNDEENEELESINFILDHEAGNSPLTSDENGYLHMVLNTGTWQTIKTIYGYVYRDGSPVNVLKFAWASSHYWVLNDTLGYIVDIGLNEQYQFVAYDTTYITGFSGFEVPCVNGARYLWNLISATGIFFIGFGITTYHGVSSLFGDHHSQGSFLMVISILGFVFLPRAMLCWSPIKMFIPRRGIYHYFSG
jgi:hypothetical protein